MLAIALPILALLAQVSSSPQPGIVAGPIEVRIHNATPITPAQAEAFVGRSIAFTAIGAPANTPPLGRLAIAGARLADGNRTLILATDPHPFQAAYRLEFPEALARTPVVYTIHGAEASWAEGDGQGEPAWTVSLPAFGTSTLAPTQTASLAKPGQLTLRSRVVLPAGRTATFHLTASAPFEAILGDFSGMSEEAADHGFTLDVPYTSQGDPAELWAILETGREGQAPTLTLSVRSDDNTPAPALLLPWANPAPPGVANPAPITLPFDLAGGDPTRGAEVFRSQEARCAQCHKAGGEGGDVGPDLVNQSGRDLALIYRDVAEPSVVIPPDYITYTVARHDGQVAVGVLRAKGPDTLRVLDTDAKETLIPREDVADIQPSGASVMPVGLVGALGEQRVRDLLAFLHALPPATTNPPQE